MTLAIDRTGPSPRRTRGWPTWAVIVLVVSGVLAGVAPEEREILYNVVGRAGAIRVGRWKLLRRRDGAELYDLEADPNEARDVAAEHPERVRALGARLDAWAAKAAPPLYDASHETGFAPPAVWGGDG